jgi:hypothetical protein
MRHSHEIITHVKELRAQGFTLSEIITETGLRKTTIFHYIKSIPKSEFLKKKLRTISRELQKQIADSRRGKSTKAYTFKRPSKWNKELVNLVAHFMFDGQITRTSCIYYNRSQVLRDAVIANMIKVIGVDDYKIYDASGGVKRVCYFNVELACFIKQKSQELFLYINSASVKHKLSFLKAFFDDEGCVSLTQKKRLIRGYQHSLLVLELVQKLLGDFGIKSWIDKNYFELYISKRENLIKFQKFINFTPGLCVNGARSNSIWKKDLEKREILKMAIYSYLI